MIVFVLVLNKLLPHELHHVQLKPLLHCALSLHALLDLRVLFIASISYFFKAHPKYTKGIYQGAPQIHTKDDNRRKGEKNNSNSHPSPVCNPTHQWIYQKNKQLEEVHESKGKGCRPGNLLVIDLTAPLIQKKFSRILPPQNSHVIPIITLSPKKGATKRYHEERTKDATTT